MKGEVPDILGIQLNNWGNIENTKDHWDGLVLPSRHKRFATFEAPEYSVRALGKIFRNYLVFHRAASFRDPKTGKSYGIASTFGLINTWAPPKATNGVPENDTELYLDHMALWGGFAVGDTPNLYNRAQARKWASAVILQEVGRPLDAAKVIEHGLDLLGGWTS